MPFRSNAQRKYLYAKLPDVAEKFAADTVKKKKLPEHVASKGKRRKLTPPKG